MAGEDRVEAVEVKCAHLEHALQSLSDVVYRQQRELDRVLAMTRALASRLEDLSASSGEAAQPDETPPHY